MADELEEINSLIEQSNTVRQQAEEKVAQLKQRIKEGNYSTGDLIKDFIISSYGFSQGGPYEKIKELRDKINDNLDKQVLVVGETREKHDRDGCFGQSHYLRSGRYLCLGTISGELSFNNAEGYIIIPTDYHIQSGSSWLVGFEGDDRAWEKRDGLPVSLTPDQLLFLYKKEFNFGDENSLCSLYVLVDQEIPIYFGESNSFRSISDIVEGIRKGELHHDTIKQDSFYKKGLEILGLSP